MQNYVIDAEDASVYPLSDLVEKAWVMNKLDSDGAIIELEWLSLVNAIKGKKSDLKVRQLD